MYKIIIKKLIVLILLLLFTKTYSQSINEISDSIVINSPPYRNYYLTYKKVRIDTSFMKKINSDSELRILFDSTEKYYKLFEKRINNSKLLFLSGIPFFALNIILKNPIFAIPPFINLGYEFGKRNYGTLITYKFYFYSIKLLKDFNKKNWKVNRIDKRNYITFKYIYESTQRRMLKKGKYLNLLN